MWNRGYNQFLPFALTVIAIVLTDLLIGIVIGLVVAVFFILYDNLSLPIKILKESHVGGQVLRIKLGDQVSFLNKAVLQQTLDKLESGQRVLIDAGSTMHIDSDVREMLKDFDQITGPARSIEVSLVGFGEESEFKDRIQFIDTPNRELQSRLKPMEVKNLLLEGNQRFLAGQRMLRDFNRQIDSTSEGQYPLAVMLSCIDSRTPAELVFDLGLGDIFSIRIAGNVAKEKVLGSMEYGCQVAGAKLVVVMGHTRCGAVGSSVDLFLKKLDPSATGCEHLGPLVQEIQKSLSEQDRRHIDESPEQLQKFIDHIAMLNMRRTVQYVRTESHSLARMEQEGKIALCGAMYDVSTGAVIFDT
jgi:carbonic anhydrase/SulP family sulfate permease